MDRLIVIEGLRFEPCTHITLDLAMFNCISLEVIQLENSYIVSL